MSMTIRRVLAAVLTAAVTLTGAIAGVIATTSPADAAPVQGFDPGMIITDELFYDGNAMTAAQIQSFLNQQVPTCHPEWDANPSDIVCIKDYVTSTVAKNTVITSGGTVLCTAVDARSGVTAAQVIDIVARACGVSQKVLIVLLQKEQGLITHQWPSSYRYDKATGYACPDTAPCDAQYFGLFNQLYNAALQFKRYKAYPTSYGYRAGQTNFIAYHPYTYSTGACGRASVYIQNQATAGLYNYTPYVPNSEALKAGYGQGDTCSSYGNRNFYLYYTDWFGPTAFSVNGGLRTTWLSLGGESGPGSPTSNAFTVSANGGGWYQEFENGTIYYTKSGVGTYRGRNTVITEAYNEAGGPAGPWGFPLDNGTCADGWCFVTFQHETAFFSSSTGVTTSAPIGEALLDAHADRGGSATLGDAEDFAVRLDDGWYQDFETGTLYVADSGAEGFRSANAGITTLYDTHGGPAGEWGWPLSDGACDSGVCEVPFENRTVYYTPATGIVVGFPVAKELEPTWTANGGFVGVGQALSAEASPTGDAGVVQEFARGWVFSGPDGTTAYRARTAGITRAYMAAGGPEGDWGWPLSDGICASNVCQVRFENRTVYYSPATGTVVGFPVDDRTLSTWTANGGFAGAGQALGFAAAPTEDAGVAQQFARGWVFVSPQGTAVYRPSSAIITASYLDAGGPAGPWGWPLTAGACASGVCEAKFDNLTAYFSSSTGVTTGPSVRNGMRAAWLARGALAGPGTPVTGEIAISENGGGWMQTFSQGTIYYSASGAVAYRAAGASITTAYEQAGGPGGSWGWPLGDGSCSNGVCSVPFQHVTVSWTSATGVVARPR